MTSLRRFRTWPGATRANRSLAFGACVAALAAAAPAARAEDAATRCEQRSEYQRLRFWLGRWDVVVAGKPAGRDTIAAVLGGCAILENWTEPDGSEGKSWFYYDPASARWKQVWITDRAWQLGGTKEKAELPGPEAGPLRLQGVLVAPDGRRILDRTTLTRNADGTVRQVIETSIDAGLTWTSRWDALYRRAPPLRRPAACARAPAGTES